MEGRGYFRCDAGHILIFFCGMRRLVGGVTRVYTAGQQDEPSARARPQLRVDTEEQRPNAPRRHQSLWPISNNCDIACDRPLDHAITVVQIKHFGVPSTGLCEANCSIGY